MNITNTLDLRTKEILSASTKIRKFVNDIIDEKSFVELDRFACGKSYIDSSIAPGEGVVTGYATIGGEPVYLFAENYEVLKGSFGKAHAEKIIKVINLAITNQVPIVGILDSDGARIGEGVSVLEAYASVIKAITVASINIPIVSIIKGNCVGVLSGVPALSDYVFMSDKAILSMASPSVVTAKEGGLLELNSVLGATMHMSKSGLCDFVFKTPSTIKDKLTKIFALTKDMVSTSSDTPMRAATSLNSAITSTSLINAVTDKSTFIELNEKFAEELKCGIASVNGISSGIAICDSSVSKKLSRNALKKLSAFVEYLDKFNLPFISLVDSAGIESSLSDEEENISNEYANAMASIALSSIPKIAVICGKAIGASYSLLASKSLGYDYVISFSNAIITPVEAAVAVNLMYADDIKKAKDTSKARETIANRYNELEGNAVLSASEGYIDDIISPQNVRPYIASALLMLLGV